MNRYHLELLVHSDSQTILTKIDVKCFSAENVPLIVCTLARLGEGEAWQLPTLGITGN